MCYTTSRVVWTHKTSLIYSRQVLSTPLITNPTRVTDHSAKLIDNIHCNIPEVSTHCKAGILKLSISDNDAIFVHLKIHHYVIKWMIEALCTQIKTNMHSMQRH